MEYETISLDDYIQTGEGGTALAYTHKTEKRLAKLYNTTFEADLTRREFEIARVVYELGIPTPRPYRLITDGTRFGAEYELIPGKISFARMIARDPAQMEPVSLRFAQMARELHAKPADTVRLRSYRDFLTQYYENESVAPEFYRKRALAFLQTVPDTPTCSHGDLHIGNIITDGQRTLWIDVGQFAYGAPEWDLSMFWWLSLGDDEARTRMIFNLSCAQLREHWALFARAYLGTDSAEEVARLERRLGPYAAVKIPNMMEQVYHHPLLPQTAEQLLPLFDPAG